MKKIIHTILLLLSISVYVHAANYDYLIVTTTKYTDAANRLKDWEASRGYKPYVMYLDTIHEGWQYTWTNRTTQKIREFYTKYGYNNIQYLTIIGCDTDIMPTTISPQVYDGNSDTSKYVKFTNSNGVNYYNIYGSIYNYRDWGAGIPIMTDNEFARNGKIHTNGIENFWGLCKSRLTKFRGIDKQTFILHIKECEFRYNHRHENLFNFLLKNFRKKPLKLS